MFDKKKCPKCRESIKESFEFCPSCGNRLKNTDEDFGMLGRNDKIEQNNLTGFPFGGGIFEKMLGTTMKMLEKELQKGAQENSNGIKPNFELFINGKRIDPKNIKVTKHPIQKNQKQIQKRKAKTLPMNEIKDFSKLPQEEPKTNIRRIADSVIYEIELPGVNSEKEITILNLGGSVEVRAASKIKAYTKTISTGLPIIDYAFSEGMLVLEFEAGN